MTRDRAFNGFDSGCDKNIVSLDAHAFKDEQIHRRCLHLAAAARCTYENHGVGGKILRAQKLKIWKHIAMCDFCFQQLYALEQQDEELMHTIPCDAFEMLKTFRFVLASGLAMERMGITVQCQSESVRSSTPVQRCGSERRQLSSICIRQRSKLTKSVTESCIRSFQRRVLPLVYVLAFARFLSAP